jgi:hypothetical protein
VEPVPGSRLVTLFKLSLCRPCFLVIEIRATEAL